MPNQSVRWLLAELVVVVLGILIAFQVEEWRTNRGDQQFYRASLQAILVELEDEYSDFQRAIPSVDRQLKSAARLSSLLRGNQPRDEAQIVEAYGVTLSSYDWRPNASTYTGLRESGRIYLLSDSELVERLFDYYEFGEFVGTVYVSLRTNRERFIEDSLVDFYDTPADEILIDEITIQLKRHLVKPLEDIPRAPEFIGSLGRLMRSLNQSARRLDAIAARNLELQEFIRTRIESKGSE